MVKRHGYALSREPRSLPFCFFTQRQANFKLQFGRTKLAPANQLPAVQT
jgi:hypothetical protein